MKKEQIEERIKREHTQFALLQDLHVLPRKGLEDSSASMSGRQRKH